MIERFLDAYKDHSIENVKIWDVRVRMKRI